MARVLFIQDIVYEYFGVMHISSYLKKHGHECDVIIEFAEKNWIKKVEDYNPDFIAFSVLSGSYKWAVDRASILKEKFNKPIIFGGVHVYLNPQTTIQELAVDIICTGEGEESMKNLCSYFDVYNTINNNTKGFWFKDNGVIIKNDAEKLIEDLDSLPFPDREIYYKYAAIKDRDILPMLGSRGCPYTCSYCVIPAAKKIFEGQGKFIRERSSVNILSEIDYCLLLSKKKQFVHFVEDHFGNNRELALEVLKGVSKRNNGTLAWGGAIRVERFNKEEYVKELSKTNHGMLGIAVECGDEEYRYNVLKRYVKNSEIIKAASLAKKYGIKFDTLNMVGLPGETFEQAVMTLEFNIELNPEFANCYVYQPYPGTDLQRYSVEHGFLDESVIKNIGLSFYDRYWKNNKELNLIINIQRIFGFVVKYPKTKNVMIGLAKNNYSVLVDLIFGLYYMWWLLYYYKLTIRQVYKLIATWLYSKFSFDAHPSSESIKQGEGQLYPNAKK